VTSWNGTWNGSRCAPYSVIIDNSQCPTITAQMDSTRTKSTYRSRVSGVAAASSVADAGTAGVIGFE
jgi:hypothetical protein